MGFEPADIHNDLELHRRIVESTHDCIKVLDLEGRLVYLSPKGQELLGICDLAPFLRRPWVELWQSPWKEMAAAAIESARAGGRGAFQGFCPTLDGTPKWWDVVVTPIAGPDGTVSALLAISRDVTTQKEALDALRDANVRMTEISSQLAHVARLTMLGTLTASIAHELTQPLTAVMANARAARRLVGEPIPDLGQVTAALDDIVRDDQRASDIIEHFRRLLIRGDPAKELCDLNSTIEAVVAMLRADALERGIVLDCRFDAATLVRVDRVQLQQLALNLVMNAFDAVSVAAPGARHVTITTRRQHTRVVVVSVENDGPPVSPEHLSRLREPFYTTKADGLGLGLAICRQILAAHRSELRAERKSAGGMVFSFTLRSAARKGTARASERSASQAANAAAVPRGPRVLARRQQGPT